MIYGELRELKFYKGISENLDKAIECIESGVYKNGVSGKNEIDGDNLFFNCQTVTTQPIEERFFEGHKKYIDIHIVIEGDENIGYVPASKAKVTKEYDAEGDYELLSGDLEMFLHLDNTKFLALFPGEPHMALVKYGEKPATIKKVIFKVMA